MTTNESRPGPCRTGAAEGDQTGKLNSASPASVAQPGESRRGSAFGLLACTDCTAVGGPGQLVTHDATCPRALATDAASADDGAWFKRHPEQRTRRRPLSWPERAALGISADAPGHAVVTQLASGIRHKRLIAGSQP